VSGQVLAIDLGTTGVKVVIVDDTGSVLGFGTETFPTIHLPNDGAEQDPEGWWAAIGRCARKALAAGECAAGDVEAVAVTAQYMSTVAIDATGHPLMNTVMWMDGRGRKYHEHLLTLEAAVLWIDVHGLPPLGNDDLAHIAFIAHERPDVYEAAAAFVEPVDYLVARLTGRVTATQSTAFPLLTIDNRKHGTTEYSDELVTFARVDPAKLPPLVPFDEVRGNVTSEAADHLGITTAAVVVTGTIDSITSAVGSGALDHTSCSIIIGTTTVIVTHVDDKRADFEHGLTTVPSPLPGKYFVMAENGIGGKALEVFLHNIVYADDGFSSDGLPDDAFARAEVVAASTPPGANGVLFQPWLVGSMAPGLDDNVRSGFVNLGLTSNRADMCRAVFEGVAANAAWLLPHVAALAGSTYSKVNFGGGGAASDVWGQMLADVFGIAVHRLSEPGATNARGAAFLALERTGHIALRDIPSLLRTVRVHEPDPANRARYERLTAALVDFHDRASPFYTALNQEARSSE
jgi:xylulokinase